MVVVSGKLASPKTFAKPSAVFGKVSKKQVKSNIIMKHFQLNRFPNEW